MHSDSVRYLEQAGFHYKPAESPDLWTHLESRFSGPGIIGPRFVPMSASSVAELIAMGEEALLEGMVMHHRQTGTPGRVARVIDLPYVIGTVSAIPLTKADPGRVLRLIEQPGTPGERVIHVVPAEADEIPCTSRMTVTGGVYADGHTAGYYDLRPGEESEAGKEAALAYLATREEIAVLAREMETKIEDIATVTRRECEEMVERARRALGERARF